MIPEELTHLPPAVLDPGLPDPCLEEAMAITQYMHPGVSERRAGQQAGALCGGGGGVGWGEWQPALPPVSVSACFAGAAPSGLSRPALQAGCLSNSITQ